MIVGVIGHKWSWTTPLMTGSQIFDPREQWAFVVRRRSPPARAVLLSKLVDSLRHSVADFTSICCSYESPPNPRKRCISSEDFWSPLKTVCDYGFLKRSECGEVLILIADGGWKETIPIYTYMKYIVGHPVSGDDGRRWSEIMISIRQTLGELDW